MGKNCFTFTEAFNEKEFGALVFQKKGVASTSKLTQEGLLAIATMCTSDTDSAVSRNIKYGVVSRRTVWIARVRRYAHCMWHGQEHPSNMPSFADATCKVHNTDFGHPCRLKLPGYMWPHASWKRHGQRHTMPSTRTCLPASPLVSSPDGLPSRPLLQRLSPHMAQS